MMRDQEIRGKRATGSLDSRDHTQDRIYQLRMQVDNF